MAATGTRPPALTSRQRTVLYTLHPAGTQTARQLGVRSDVMWRLEHMGLVAGGIGPEVRYSITAKGREALTAAMIALGLWEA